LRNPRKDTINYHQIVIRVYSSDGDQVTDLEVVTVIYGGNDGYVTRVVVGVSIVSVRSVGARVIATRDKGGGRINAIVRAGQQVHGARRARGALESAAPANCPANAFHALRRIGDEIKTCGAFIGWLRDLDRADRPVRCREDGLPLREVDAAV
jgi:hypothetical protein